MPHFRYKIFYDALGNLLRRDDDVQIFQQVVMAAPDAIALAGFPAWLKTQPGMLFTTTGGVINQQFAFHIADLNL